MKPTCQRGSIAAATMPVPGTAMVFTVRSLLLESHLAVGDTVISAENDSNDSKITG